MLNEDYRDILRLLLKEKVRFLIVGAYALGAYGYPRAIPYKKVIKNLKSKGEL